MKNYKSIYENNCGIGNHTIEKQAFEEIIKGLESGEIRVANKIDGEWKVNHWVKEAILWGFRLGKIDELRCNPFKFFDKDTIPLSNITLQSGVRIVPGGSSIRGGSYLAPNTVVMPPSYINIGAYVDAGSMIDSHALVGSCAQVGKNVHLSAASQLGGVLEPVGALPVIIEDNVFIGGNCGIYEGTVVRQNAVIGTGVVLNRSTAVFDSTTGEFLTSTESGHLTIPENAVVVAGSRPLKRGAGREMGIHLYTPVIIKYRDEKTILSLLLEDELR